MLDLCIRLGLQVIDGRSRYAKMPDIPTQLYPLATPRACSCGLGRLCEQKTSWVRFGAQEEDQKPQVECSFVSQEEPAVYPAEDGDEEEVGCMVAGSSDSDHFLQDRSLPKSPVQVYGFFY